MADSSKFQYKCSGGHTIYSPVPVTKCVGFNKGVPCKGALTRFGPGSRTEKKEKK